MDKKDTKRSGLAEAKKLSITIEEMNKNIAEIERYEGKKVDFLRWVVVTALGFITIFTSLNSTIPEDLFLQWLYGAIIVVVSFAILFSGVAVYGPIHENYLNILRTAKQFGFEGSKKYQVSGKTENLYRAIYEHSGIWALIGYFVFILLFIVYNMRKIYIG